MYKKKEKKGRERNCGSLKRKRKRKLEGRWPKRNAGKRRGRALERKVKANT